MNSIDKVLKKKEFRFLLVGVLNTIFGYLCFSLFVLLGIQYLIANVLSTVLGVFHSYLWNKYYTFKSKSKSISEVLRFSSVYLLSFLLGTGTLFLMVDRLRLSPYVAGAINIFITTCISWFGHNYFSFNNDEMDKFN